MTMFIARTWRGIRTVTFPVKIEGKLIYKSNRVDGYIAVVTYLFSEKGVCVWNDGY